VALGTGGREDVNRFATTVIASFAACESIQPYTSPATERSQSRCRGAALRFGYYRKPEPNQPL